jgi:hypothetical protein
MYLNLRSVHAPPEAKRKNMPESPDNTKSQNLNAV